MVATIRPVLSCRSCCFFFSSRRRHTRCLSDWSSDVCSSDLCPRRSGQGVLACGRWLRACATSGATRWSAGCSRWIRSEERRVGKECRYGGWADHYEKEGDTTCEKLLQHIVKDTERVPKVAHS